MLPICSDLSSKFPNAERKNKAKHSSRDSLPDEAKMSPRPQIHRGIQGQRFFFHLNPLAAQPKPCQRRQVAVGVPNQTIDKTIENAHAHFQQDTAIVEIGLVTSSGWQGKTQRRRVVF